MLKKSSPRPRSSNEEGGDGEFQFLVLGARGEEGNQTARRPNAEGVVEVGRGTLPTEIEMKRESVRPDLKIRSQLQLIQ